MAASVMLFTDRPGCEPIWRPACELLGLSVETLSPDRLAKSVRRTSGIIIDGESQAYDEDELLATLGFARAVGAVAATQVPADDSMASIDDLLGELCPGLVAHTEDEVARVVALLARRLDDDRARRFEFVTISPRGGELLAILGDGRSVLLERPVGDGDDGGDVTSIELVDDGQGATVDLSGGGHVRLDAGALAELPALVRVGAEPTGAPSTKSDNGSPAANGTSIDVAHLGARLRKLRLAAGLTQAELARRTGIHRPNIARVEAGRHTPSLETLARLAMAIGVPTARVLSED
jgi:DNA-binding XRE family transcriptional regulator